jgi:hypothetical protein
VSSVPPVLPQTRGGAVFLSYASQDADAARNICEVLRQGGIEVWFDQSKLRGGDSWDQSIRRQIKTCALFIPVVSRKTHDRDEGYFRLERKLAVERSHLITPNRAFLVGRASRRRSTPAAQGGSLSGDRALAQISRLVTSC